MAPRQGLSPKDWIAPMTHKIAPRYWPEIKFPVHRALERYRTYLALSDIAVKIKRDGWRIDAKRAQAHEQAAMKRAERYKGIFLKATGLKVDALGAAGTGQTNSIR